MPALFSPFLGWVAQILLFLCHCVHGVLPILVGSMENHCWDVPRNFNYLGGIHFWAELWRMNRSFFIFPERLLSLQKLSQKFFFAKVSRWRRQKFKSELDLKSFSSDAACVVPNHWGKGLFWKTSFMQGHGIGEGIVVWMVILDSVVSVRIPFA